MKGQGMLRMSFLQIASTLDVTMQMIQTNLGQLPILPVLVHEQHYGCL